MGALLWCTMTRPDVSYYVAFLCQFMSDPSLEAYEAGLAVLSYLNTTRELGITYDGRKRRLLVYTDSSWSKSPKPFHGHAILYCGAVVSFQARKTKILPQSSAEAESAAYSVAAKDLAFVLNVMGEECLHDEVELPVPIMCDSEAAIATLTKPGVTQRTRHYESWVLYGREQYPDKISIPTWVPTRDQLADIFTKALDKNTFERMRDSLMNVAGGSISAALSRIIFK